jgi:hypothetical protein
MHALALCLALSQTGVVDSASSAHFLRRGYAIVESVFSPAEIDRLSAAITSAVDNGSVPVLNAAGPAVFDFMSEPALRELHSLPTDPRLLAALAPLLGGAGGFRYCAHNDIGLGRTVPWHKDLMTPPFSRYMRLPPWQDATGGDGSFGLVTVAI